MSDILQEQKVSKYSGGIYHKTRTELTYNSNYIARRPLAEGEVERLTEEFVVEYTYNSNAIEGDMVKDQMPLSESIIKQIHYLVLADEKDGRGFTEEFR